MEAILKMGNKNNGNNATTGIGNASVTHKEIINTPIAITLPAKEGIPNGLIKNKSNAMPILIMIAITLCGIWVFKWLFF